MKRILVLSVFVLTLILSACSGSSDEAASPEIQSNNKANDLEKENEALRKELAEKENKELKAELEANEEDDSKNNSNEKKKEDLSTEEENDKSDPEESHTGNRADLYFDLNDDHVKNQFIGTDYGNDDGFFEQSAITKGMSQTEVEEKYGAYDFAMHVEGAAPAMYGNLAVIYSEYYPYGTDGDPARTDINPDTNYVQTVLYFADVSPDEMISILGEPEDYNNGNKTMNGLPYYVYSGTGTDGRYYSTGAETIKPPKGTTVSLISREIHDENPYDTQSSVNDDLYFSHDNDSSQSYPFNLTTEQDSYKYEVFTNYMNDYVAFLTAYYNGDSNDVLDYVKGDALSDLQDNRASGYFSDHENLGISIVNIEQLSLQEYRVTIERDYSHANSSGPATTQVSYTIFDGDNKLQITDFE